MLMRDEKEAQPEPKGKEVSGRSHESRATGPATTSHQNTLQDHQEGNSRREKPIPRKPKRTARKSTTDGSDEDDDIDVSADDLDSDVDDDSDIDAGSDTDDPSDDVDSSDESETDGSDVLLENLSEEADIQHGTMVSQVFLNWAILNNLLCQGDVDVVSVAEGAPRGSSSPIPPPLPSTEAEIGPAVTDDNDDGVGPILMTMEDFDNGFITPPVFADAPSTAASRRAYLLQLSVVPALLQLHNILYECKVWTHSSPPTICQTLN